MNKRLLAVLLIVAVAAAFLAVPTPPARAEDPTLEDEIEASIVAGLAWLADQQNPDGSWNTYWHCDSIPVTGLVVLKFETRAIELGYDPLDPAYEYSTNVQAGLNYIMGFRNEQLIDKQPAGDPDGDGDGIGVYFSTDCDYHHVIYNTGIIMMALSASGQETYEDDVQDMVDYMAWAQADEACGPHRGGWRYWPDCDSDNSNSGYVTLGLGYAAAPPPYGFGLTIPPWVKDELSLWISVMQDPVNGDPDDGGSWYAPGWPWVNTLKTGNLIYEMALVGDPVDSGRVHNAIDYIERHWYDADWAGAGWLGHRQAMFTMMKGFEAYGIDKIDLDGDGIPETEWFPVVAQHLIDTQDPAGYWEDDPWGETVLSTAWALLTLERSVPTIEQPVAVDFKPASCPNPFNMGERGRVSVAIVGTDDLDVTQIDPASVVLAYGESMVYPLRWSYEDAAIPYEPYLGKEGAYDCIEYCPDEYGVFDGYLDLVFKFNTQELAAALGGVNNGDVIVLTLRGNLLEDFGGTPIVGEDVVVIIKK